MSSPDKQWWIEQAGEYVLGTLSDSERKAFEKAIKHNSDAQQLVSEWEQTLQPLADSLAPMGPPQHVWTAIANRISGARSTNDIDQALDLSDSLDIADAVSTVDSNVVRLHEQASIAKTFERKAARWRTLAGLATAASLLLALLAWFNYSNLKNLSQSAPIASVNQFDAISIIRDDSSLPLWVVDTATQEGLVRVTAVAPPTIDASKSYQLWLVKPDNAGVQSIGLIPQGIDQSILLKVNMQSNNPDAFAVSLEPAGGSQEAGPSGPVLYQGLVQKLKL